MTSNYAFELKCFSVCVGSQFSHLTAFATMCIFVYQLLSLYTKTLCKHWKPAKPQKL